ncbi:DNA helicase UvrD [Candidatus Microgenomates bacterium]|nr:DNA helicase UvrD [Candidatus Microgenomates bacterium]
MRYLADLHLHSRYARATSKDLTLPLLDEWGRKKGIQVLATGDFTHPFWFGEIKQQLTSAPEAGLYILKDADPKQTTRFILSVEISSIYSQGGKNRRIHTLVLLPTLEAAEGFNQRLASYGNLRSDGRPILGISAKSVAQIALKAHPQAIIIPAHAWTPWYAVFGSMSGFDSLEECFEEVTPAILAIETGLSSDPSMNWQLSRLDKVALISSSDAHSASKIGREATEFEGEMSFAAMREALRSGAPQQAALRQHSPARLLGTIEFFPEEGKYHYDGHRNCQISLHPSQRIRQGNKCSKCGRNFTIGVLSRVVELSDRNQGTKPNGAPDYQALVPLVEIIAEAQGSGVATKQVQDYYQRLLEQFGNEMAVLRQADVTAVAKVTTPLVAEGIKRMRAGKLKIDPGYDGQFGTVRIFSEAERLTEAEQQASLF